MWTRAELKEMAKNALNKQYWLCVGVLFVQNAIIAAVSAMTFELPLCLSSAPLLSV